MTTQACEITLEAERSVLGACLMSRTACDEALAVLTAADWLTVRHAAIWGAVAQLCDEGEPVDVVTVRRVMGDAAPASYLAELGVAVPTTAHVKAWSARVRDLARQRRIVAAAERIIIEGARPLTDVESFAGKSEALLWDATQGQVAAQPDMKALLHGALSELETAYKFQGVTGIPTGFADLDELICGLQRAELTILAARPSMGKTAFALDMARSAGLKHGKRVLVCSLEQPGVAISKRLLGAESNVDLRAVARQKASAADWGKLSDAAGKISASGIEIYDVPALSLQQLRAHARRVASKDGLDMIVVDYLQLMTLDGRRQENRTQEVSALSRGLKAVARELNVPVVCLSQLNRSLESRSDKRPMMSDLRESGAIEQDADVIMFLYRAAYYDPSADESTELGVAKNRNGPTGRVELNFDSRRIRFLPAAEAWRSDAA